MFHSRLTSKMQKDDTLEKNLSKKELGLSLYTEEEIEGISTTSSFKKIDAVATRQVSEVSSTSEDNCQLVSTSKTSIFMDLYEEDIVDSGSKNVKDVKNNASVTGDLMASKKSKPGLMLLGEYADSGNDTEEETLNALRATHKHEESKKTEETSSNKNSSAESAPSKAFNCENETSLKPGEPEVIDTSSEMPLNANKVSSPIVEKTKGDGDFDVHALLDDSLAKFKRSVSKEEGQISAESESSDSDRSSGSKKDSRKQKDTKKDKSKKKDKKKKKKKRKKHKHLAEKKESEVTEREEKKERKLVRSRSRESLKKRKALKQSRSRSRDRDSRRRRRSRSRSQDKGRRQLKERSRRSRSRSTSRRHSATNRKKDLKSRSRSPKRSVSSSDRRRDKRSSTSRGRRNSPLSRKSKLSRSRSPRKRKDGTPEHKRSRSPRKRSRSPVKRRKMFPERSPIQRLSFRKARSPNRKERKESHLSPRKSSHHASSASESLESGDFTNIPISKINKPDELVVDNKEPVQKSPTVVEKEKESSVPPMEKEKEEVSVPSMEEKEKEEVSVPSMEEKEKEESTVLLKSTDLEKQYSPSYSPEKPWGEDEFDFVFTERMSPRQGTEKSMEDVLFGSVAKTPEFKRTTSAESKKSKTIESEQAVKKKEETKLEKPTETMAIVSKESDMLQKQENQDGSSSLQQPSSATSKSAIKTDDRSISNSKDLISDNTSVSKTEKPDIEDKIDHVKKTEDSTDADSAQISANSDKSYFVQTKLETIPFLGEATPSVPPPVPPTSQLGLLGSPPASSMLQGQTWRNLSEVGLPALDAVKHGLSKEKKDTTEPLMARKDEKRNNFYTSPLDMEMSSPEGDVIDRMNEEFWKQQQHQSGMNKTEIKENKYGEVFIQSVVDNKESSFEEPYEPESGLIIGEEYEEDLNSITDPKERRRREKQQEKEKTKVQELLDKLHRQARVEEEVKHVLKVYYKHRDISKEEYKSILRRAVPQVTNSSSAIDPERIRSLVKKYVAKIKGQR